jgi:prepilin-type N-terminal cleavage/methylation domain-containing protein
MQGLDSIDKNQGFGLIELMIATIILAFGLLAAGQFIYVTIGLNSLARSKTTATIAAQNTLEYLADLYQRNPAAEELRPGNHGPLQAAVNNPIERTLLNLYNITWTVNDVPDPRSGRAMKARRICLRVQPIRVGGSDNVQPLLNKALSITTVFSSKIR